MVATIFRHSQLSLLSLPTCDDPFFGDLFCVVIAVAGMRGIYLVVKYEAKIEKQKQNSSLKEEDEE